MLKYQIKYIIVSYSKVWHFMIWAHSRETNNYFITCPVSSVTVILHIFCTLVGFRPFFSFSRCSWAGIKKKCSEVFLAEWNNGGASTNLILHSAPLGNNFPACLKWYCFISHSYFHLCPSWYPHITFLKYYYCIIAKPGSEYLHEKGKQKKRNVTVRAVSNSWLEQSCCLLCSLLIGYSQCGEPKADQNSVQSFFFFILWAELAPGSRTAKKYTFLFINNKANSVGVCGDCWININWTLLIKLAISFKGATFFCD